MSPSRLENPSCGVGDPEPWSGKNSTSKGTWSGESRFQPLLINLSTNTLISHVYYSKRLRGYVGYMVLHIITPLEKTGLESLTDPRAAVTLFTTSYCGYIR